MPQRFKPKLLRKNNLFALLRSDTELLDFTQKFYRKLSQYSPGRQVNPRDPHERRLESVSRLLAGDEVCTAVVYDGDNLLIASNRTDHDRASYSFDYDMLVQPGSSVKNGFDMKLVYHFFEHTESGSKQLCEKEGEVIHYTYDPSTDTLSPPKNKKYTADFSFAEHQVVGLPKVSSSIELAEIPNASGSFYDNLKSAVNYKAPSWLNFTAPCTIGIKIPFPATNLDPLVRRVELLVEHLSLIANINLHNKSQEFTAKAIAAHHKNRARILKSSLSWEVARWPAFKKLNNKMRHFDKNISKDINEINKFISELNDIFTNIRNSYSVSLEEKLNKWQGIVLQKLNIESLEKPKSLPTNQLKRFLKRMKKYLEDLEKLDDYIVELSDRKHPRHGFVRKIALERPLQPKTLPKIIDDCDDKVHAEIRILHHYIQQNKAFPEYIAISKLCCAHCGFCMGQLGIDTISGVHGKAYPNWKFPKELMTDRFLASFLGDELNKLFQSYGDPKKEAALSVIQSVAGLDEKQLKDLKITDKKLWNNESEFAYESDDDSSDPSLAQLSSVMGIHNNSSTSSTQGSSAVSDTATNSKR